MIASQLEQHLIAPLGRKPRIDLNGRTFGRLRVIRFAGIDSRSRLAAWVCICECGIEGVFVGASLTKGKTSSCGCLQRENTSARRRTHGMSKSAIYNVWHGMISRCSNPSDTNYDKYGARGIRVCDRWLKFENFIADMGMRPTDDHSIERIENNKGYEPDNCVWALPKQQGRNTRANRILSINGKSATMVEWSEMSGIPYHTLKARLRSGWTGADAVSRPLRGSNQ